MTPAPTSRCTLLLDPSPFAAQGRFTGGDRARLYLLDYPGGSARVLVIVVEGDDDSFETMLEWAAPVLNSIEFHVP